MRYRSEEDNGNVEHEATLRARQMFRRAKVFTTGMVAKACRVAPRTVAKWIDDGKIPGYRLPGCNDRRVTRAQLVRFMRAQRMPLDVIGEHDGQDYVVLAGCGEAWADQFAAALGPAWDVVRAPCLFDAALKVAEHRPEAVVFHSSLGGSDCRMAASRVRQMLPDAVLIGVVPDDRPNDMSIAYDLSLVESDDPALAAACLLERSAA